MRRLLNHYRCPSCEHTWTDQWDCACDDECPRCGQRHISPIVSNDLDDTTERLARERREHALTRHLLGYAMTALAQITDGAPRTDPEDDPDEPDSYEGLEARGYAMARFGDACTAGLARSKIRWLQRAARHAENAADIARLARALRFNGCHHAPDDVAPAILDADDLDAASWRHRFGHMQF